MGSYGYICNICKTAVNAGELCYLRHVRHGEVLGETIGHYDEYGGVDEDEIFNGEDGMNSCDEIGKSEMDLPDSVENMNKYDRMINGERMDFLDYKFGYINSFYDNIESLVDEDKISPEELKELYSQKKNNDTLRSEFLSYPLVSFDAKSGIVACHKKCYSEASPEQQNDLTPSRSDPNQSWGMAREEFK